MPTENRMPRTLGVGRQDFEKIRRKNNFYEVTLITRPRRFGKTLAMSMVEKFFSIHYWARGELFEGLSIGCQGSFPNIMGNWNVQL